MALQQRVKPLRAVFAVKTGLLSDRYTRAGRRGAHAIPNLQSERSGATDAREGDARDSDDRETWLTTPVEDALMLQRPLPKDVLRVVARGEKTAAVTA